MGELLNLYISIAGERNIAQLEMLAETLKGAKVVHINSTKMGGGVAEILAKMIPLKKDLGIDAEWHIIEGPPDFYKCTKAFHNALQGLSEAPSDELIKIYEKTNRETAEKYYNLLNEAEFVFIHDPQPAPLIDMFPKRKGKWIWRCHIDISKPNRNAWRYIRKWAANYDASIFSLPDFALPLPHSQYIIQPSIDPLSDKNRNLTVEEKKSILDKYSFDPHLPIVLQVSRFDKFKDPLGVIKAYKLASKITKLQLVLAGGTATDDPEGEFILNEVRKAVQQDQNIFVLDLPSDANLEINALQRIATVVIQKSLKEGFGLTVTEAMWKRKPVIGGDAGGIRLQVYNHYTGFLVQTPEGAALRIRYLLQHRRKRYEMGVRGKRLVLENFLITRHLRDYLSLLIVLSNRQNDKIHING
jgi:trehalose synthase